RGVRVAIHDQALIALLRREFAHARALLEESLALSGDPRTSEDAANSVSDLGILALYERRYEDAGALFAQALDAALEGGWHAALPVGLRGLAAGAAARGELAAAARVLGAAEAIEAQIGEEAHLHPYAREAFAAALAPLVERASEPELAAAIAEGR